MTCRVIRMRRKPSLRLICDTTGCNHDAESGERPTCRAAVMRAYRELRQRGLDDLAAFEAGVTLYQLRHPEADSRTATEIVADWLSAEPGPGAEAERYH